MSRARRALQTENQDTDHSIPVRRLGSAEMMRSIDRLYRESNDQRMQRMRKTDEMVMDMVRRDQGAKRFPPLHEKPRTASEQRFVKQLYEEPLHAKATKTQSIVESQKALCVSSTILSPYAVQRMAERLSQSNPTSLRSSHVSTGSSKKRRGSAKHGRSLNACAAFPQLRRLTKEELATSVEKLYVGSVLHKKASIERLEHAHLFQRAQGAKLSKETMESLVERLSVRK